MMYEIIGRELKYKNLENAHPSDYLNFYCLGNREPHEDLSCSSGHSAKGEDVVILFFTSTLRFKFWHSFIAIFNKCFSVVIKGPIVQLRPNWREI